MRRGPCREAFGPPPRAIVPAVACLVATWLTAVPAHGETTKAPPSAERIRSAEAEFSAGRRAYTAKDFEQAAIHFENAYNDAPAAEPLKNAIRSRRLARQLARAATLAALAQTEYPNDASTVALSGEVLKEASPKFHEVTLACTPECSVAADGRLVSLSTAAKLRFFLPPGAHQLVVSWGEDRTKMTDVDAKAGGKDDLALEAPPILPPKPTTVVALGPTSGNTDTPAPTTKPLPPWVFFVGAGLTAAGIAGTIVSGIDASQSPGPDVVRERCKGLGESCPEYQEGLGAQTRTNVILGVTGGVALGTAVVGLFFTQWSRPKAATARVVPWVAPIPGGATSGFVGRF
ncbi:MAG: hypothetical protein U0169_18225 [Polyangiaceae bacterium]